MYIYNFQHVFVNFYHPRVSRCREFEYFTKLIDKFFENIEWDIKIIEK
jgi:hypothetical protein